MWLLLIAPLCSLYCFIQARRAGLRPLIWTILGAVAGPLALPLFHNHKRLQLRKAIGHGKVWFRP